MQNMSKQFQAKLFHRINGECQWTTTIHYITTGPGWMRIDLKGN
jgi:hypothetical protein